MSNYAVTSDGRYFVVKGRLWRCSDPSLSEDERGRLVKELMNARRAVKKSKSSGDATELRVARELVNDAKVKLVNEGRHGGRTVARTTTEKWL